MDGIDQHRLAQLLALMGRERLLGLAGQLQAGLAALAAAPVADQPELAHRLRGGAASLGLDALAAELAVIEAGQGDAVALAAQARTVVAMLDAALHGVSRQR